MRKTISEIHDIAHAVASSSHAANWLAKADERVKEADKAVSLSSKAVFRDAEARDILSAVYAWGGDRDGSPDELLTTGELLAVAARIASRREAARPPKPAPTTADGVPLFPLIDRQRAARAEPREVAPGLYIGRASDGTANLYDREINRGYVTRWSTDALPDGYRVHCWNADHSREIRRTFPNQAAAERALARLGAQLASERSGEAEQLTEAAGDPLRHAEPTA